MSHSSFPPTSSPPSRSAREAYLPTSLAVSFPNTSNGILSIEARWSGGRAGLDSCREVRLLLVIDPTKSSQARLCEPTYVAFDVHARDDAMADLLGLEENLTERLSLTPEMGHGFLESLYGAIEQKFPGKTFDDTIQNYLGIDVSDFRRIVVAALSRHVDKPRNTPQQGAPLGEVAVTLKGKVLSLA